MTAAEPADRWLGGLLALALGAAAFCLATGGGILFPTNLDFLQHGDPAQHYVGWSFFRDTPWLQLPPGANPAYGGEIGSSIVFTDSIPLLAFFFKPWSRLLPESFQYTGMWTLLCFCLQAWFARALLARWTANRWLQLIGTAFFVLAPPFLWRLRGHFALLGQWLILAGFWLYLARRHSLARWCALAAVAALVHAYLWCMVMAIWAADLWQRRATGELDQRQTLRSLTAAAAASLATMWCAGYFMVGGSFGASGYGFYRLNLAAFLDSDGDWSRLLPDVPQAPGDYEGFAFFGLSMLLLAAFAIALWLRQGAAPISRARLRPLLWLAAGLSVLAISNHVGIGAYKLFSMRLPFRIMTVASILRSSGRLIWPVYYLAYLAVFRIVLQRAVGAVQRRAVMAGLALLALQIFDSSRAYAMLRDRLAGVEPPPAVLRSAFWAEAARLYRGIVVVLPGGDDERSLPLARLAAEAGMTIDSGYFSRTDAAEVRRLRAAVLREVLSGRLDPQKLYVFGDEHAVLAAASARADDAVATVDGFQVLAPRMKSRRPSATPLGGVEEITAPCPVPSDRMFRFGRADEGRACLASGWRAPQDLGVWASASRAAVLLQLGQVPVRETGLEIDAYATFAATASERVVEVLVNGQPAGELRFDRAHPNRARTLPLPPAVTSGGDAAYERLFVQFEIGGEPASPTARDDRHGVGFRLGSMSLVAMSPHPTARRPAELDADRR